MARLPNRAGGWCLRWALVAVPLLLADAARADDVETREFTIRIDGDVAGTYLMTITKYNDGSVSMQGKADVKVKKFGITTYTYSYSGAEIWKNGRLLRLASKANDDGKQFEVVAAALPNGLQVTTNGQTRNAPDAWVTTYWQAPGAHFRNKSIPLLDADTGKDIAATLQFVGVTPVTFGGQAVNCNHYQLAGGVKVKLWYDGSDRLVREESTEDGHAMTLELTKMTKR
jgi:hypothetical protein